jgi:hypothetical protein
LQFIFESTSILNCDKTDFEFSNLNNKCLSKSVNSDNTDFSDLNNNCFNESIYNDNPAFLICHGHVRKVLTCIQYQRKLRDILKRCKN